MYNINEYYIIYYLIYIISSLLLIKIFAFIFMQSLYKNKTLEISLKYLNKGNIPLYFSLFAPNFIIRKIFPIINWENSL